jgi:hypothetical protein
MTLTAPRSETPPASRSARIGALAASGSLLLLATAGAASILAAHAHIAHAVTALLASR